MKWKSHIHIFNFFPRRSQRALGSYLWTNVTLPNSSLMVKELQFCLVSCCWLHKYEPPKKSTQEPTSKMVTKGEDPPCLIRKQNMVIVTRDNKARNILLCQNNWRVKQLPLPKVFIQFKEVISNIVGEFLSRVRSLLSNLTRLTSVVHIITTKSGRDESMVAAAMNMRVNPLSTAPAGPLVAPTAT